MTHLLGLEVRAVHQVVVHASGSDRLEVVPSALALEHPSQLTLISVTQDGAEVRMIRDDSDLVLLDDLELEPDERLALSRLPVAVPSAGIDLLEMLCTHDPWPHVIGISLGWRDASLSMETDWEHVELVEREELQARVERSVRDGAVGRVFKVLITAHDRSEGRR